MLVTNEDNDVDEFFHTCDEIPLKTFHAFKEAQQFIDVIIHAKTTDQNENYSAFR